MEQSQRRTPRFPFSAPAEILRGVGTFDQNQTVDRTQVNELSLYGCYLDTKSPLPRGSQVTIKIYSNGQFFEAAATVIYSQPTLGMGLAFRQVKPTFLAILQLWLRQALEKQNTLPSIDNFDSDTQS